MNDLTFNLILLEKDSRPANSTMYAAMDKSKDANWGEGDLVCTLENSAVYSNGAIEIVGLNKAARYNAADKFTSGQKGCVRWWIKPQYAGTSAYHQSIIDINTGATPADNSRIAMLHGTGGGTMSLYMYDSSGNVINVVNLPTWQADQYELTEFELGWDLANSKTAFFINGVRWGNIQTGTGTRDIGTQIRFGNHFNGTTTGNFHLMGAVVFSEMQHENNYTPFVFPNATIPKIWGYTQLPAGTNIDMSTLTFYQDPQ